eukprot:2246712-Rhodomonas_salina.3
MVLPGDPVSPIVSPVPHRRPGRSDRRRSSITPTGTAGRNQIQETIFSAPLVPELWFLVFDLALPPHFIRHLSRYSTCSSFLLLVVPSTCSSCLLSAVLSRPMSRYRPQHRLCCYALSGTDIACDDR